MQRAEGWPDAIPLEPAEAASPVLEDVLRRLSSTPVLLLAVGPLAQRGGWAAQAAIALADALAARGERVVVADLSLDRPELHERVGIDNTEGLTDVFLFGASLEHVTRMLPAHSFELIPAAAFTPDVEEILVHRRWRVVFEELAASKSRLLLYLPVSVQGTGAFSDRVGHTVVLADRWEAESVRTALSSDAEILAFLTPPRSAEPEPAPPKRVRKAEPEPGLRLADSEFEKIRVPKDSAREALIADLRARQRAALMNPQPALKPLPEEVDVVKTRREAAPPRTLAFPPATPGISEPTFASTRRVKKKKSSYLPLLLVLLVVSSAAAGWHYWGRDYWEARGNTVQTPPASTSPNSAAPAGQPAEPALPEGRPMPYSVAIAVYQLLDLAQEQLAQLRQRTDRIQFYVAPAVVQGSLFYRVLAGPLPDSATAVAVRDSLVDLRIKTLKLDTDVMEAPWSFLIGTFPTRAAAQAKQMEALARGVPTYVVPVGTGGRTLYRLYAGTYTGPGDAEFMRAILRSAELPDTLVERTGSISS